MRNREINETRTKLLMKMAEAGRAVLEFDPLAAGALAAIPNTEPQQYVVAGTLAMIGKLLSVPAAAGIEGLTRYEPDISCGPPCVGTMEEIESGNYYLVADVERLLGARAGELVKAKARISELEAARIAYASEFPLTDDGDPDIGSIHTNIRKLKAQVGAHAGVVAEPVAWMQDDRKLCTTAESKRQMENAGFGKWAEIAARYTIPLYAAPAAQAPAEVDIDSSDFMELLCKFYHESSCEEFNQTEYDAARKAVIDHIKSAKVAAQAPVQPQQKGDDK